MDPARYTAIALVGAGVFVLATVVNEFLLVATRPPLSRALAVVGASLVLSFGIGMLSGGLQHFEDFPARGAVLVPLGMVGSFVGFVARDAHTSWQRIFGPIGLVVATAAVVAYFGLGALATSMDGSGSHGHGHGEEAPALIGTSSPVGHEEEGHPAEEAHTGGAEDAHESGHSEAVRKVAPQSGHNDGHGH